MKLENLVSRPTKILLRIFGIWPESSCISLCRLFWIVAITLEQVFQYRYIIVHFRNINIPDLMNILSETITNMILFIKLGIFWYKKRTFDKILTMMATDWKKYSSTEFNRLAMACQARLSQRFCNLTVALHVTTVLLYSSNVLAQHASNDTAASNGSARALILRMELPFDYNKRFIYELVVITQYIYLTLSSCAMGILNAVLIKLVLHLGGQIDILRGWLMDMFSKEQERGPSLIVMRKVMGKHQKIIVFSEHIERLYSNIAMVLFVTDTLTICCLGFILVSSVASPDATEIIMRTTLFYFIMNIEAFVYCFAGEYLSDKSKTVGDAAYNSLWYEWDSKDSRIILLLMMRSQNQLTITIGKITNLSLERFTGIVKASASYISVLLAMY